MLGIGKAVNLVWNAVTSAGNWMGIGVGKGTVKDGAGDLLQNAEKIPTKSTLFIPGSITAKRLEPAESADFIKKQAQERIALLVEKMPMLREVADGLLKNLDVLLPHYSQAEATVQKRLEGAINQQLALLTSFEQNPFSSAQNLKADLNTIAKKFDALREPFLTEQEKQTRVDAAFTAQFRQKFEEVRRELPEFEGKIKPILAQVDNLLQAYQMGKLDVSARQILQDTLANVMATLQQVLQMKQDPQDLANPFAKVDLSAAQKILVEADLVGIIAKMQVLSEALIDGKEVTRGVATIVSQEPKPLEVQIAANPRAPTMITVDELIGVETSSEKLFLQFNMELNQIIAQYPQLQGASHVVLDTVDLILSYYEKADSNSQIQLENVINQQLNLLKRIATNPFSGEREYSKGLQNNQTVFRALLEPFLTGNVKIDELTGIEQPEEKMFWQFRIQLTQIIAKSPNLTQLSQEVLETLDDLLQHYVLANPTIKNQLEKQINQQLGKLANPFSTEQDYRRDLLAINNHFKALVVPLLTPQEKESRAIATFANEIKQNLASLFVELSEFGEQNKAILEQANDLIALYQKEALDVDTKKVLHKALTEMQNVLQQLARMKRDTADANNPFATVELSEMQQIKIAADLEGINAKLRALRLQFLPESEPVEIESAVLSTQAKPENGFVVFDQLHSELTETISKVKRSVVVDTATAEYKKALDNLLALYDEEKSAQADKLEESEKSWHEMMEDVLEDVLFDLQDVEDEQEEQNVLQALNTAKESLLNIQERLEMAYDNVDDPID